MQDQSQSRVIVTQVLENNKPKKVRKQILKEYNEKSGKVETVLVPIEEESIAVQIDNKKKEINQNVEILDKLNAQGKQLSQQVKSLAEKVNERIKIHKEEEQERIKNQKIIVQQKKNQFTHCSMDPDQKKKRMQELVSEFKAAENYGRILAKDEEYAKKQNEDVIFIDQYHQLQQTIESIQQELKEKKENISKLEKLEKKNKIEFQKLETGKGGAEEVKRLTLELQHNRERLRRLEEARVQGKDTYDKTERLIAKYIQEYKNLQIENPKEFDLDYQIEMDPKKYKEFQEEKKRDLEKKKEKLEKEKEEKEKDEKEKQEKQEKEKEQKEKQGNKPNPSKIKDYIKEKKDITNVKPNAENYLILYRQSKDLKKLLDKQERFNGQERQQLESKINDLKLEVAIYMQKMKEREREKELAQNRLIDLEKQYELQQLEQQAEQSKQKKSKKLQPLREKVTAEQLLKEKQESLARIKQKLEKRTDLVKPEPYRLSETNKGKDKKEEQQKRSERSVQEIILDVGTRISKRIWFGYEPNEQTVFCDDCHIVGQFEISHRIKQISVLFSEQDNSIYYLTTKYNRKDKVPIEAEWKVNQELRKDLSKFKQEQWILDDGDRIRSIRGRRENGFISYLCFITKLGRKLEIGKNIDEPKEEDKPQEQEGDQDNQGGDQNKKEENPDKFVYNLNKQEVLITIVSGYSQKGENEYGISFLGFELARKLNQEEREELQKMTFEEREKKQREYQRKLLDQSLATYNEQKKYRDEKRKYILDSSQVIQEEKNNKKKEK